MQADDPDEKGAETPGGSPEDALKKTPGEAKAAAKGGKAMREARLAAALRDNLRRRKAAKRMEDTD